MPSRAVDRRYSSRLALRGRECTGMGMGIGIRCGHVRVALVVDRVGVCDGEETGVDVEGGVFVDGDGFALGMDEVVCGGGGGTYALAVWDASRWETSISGWSTQRSSRLFWFQKRKER